MKPVRILLDMDGVLCDFAETYSEINNITPEEIHRLHQDKKYNMKDVCWNRYVDEQGFSRNNPLPDASDLVLCLSVMRHDGDISKIEICTSAGGKKRYADVKIQKLEWLKKYRLDDLVAHIVVNGKHKADHIDKEKYRDILIDDTEFVVNNFRAEGGEAILHTSAEDTIEQLRKLIAR